MTAMSAWCSRWVAPSRCSTEPVRRWRGLAQALLGGCLAATVQAAPAPESPATVSLATLEWPPYTGASLPDQGEVTRVVREAYAAVGVVLRVEVMPWPRAVSEGLYNPDVLGYFPRYLSAQVLAESVCSAPVGQGPLGFAEREDRPVRWQSLTDLQGLRIGVVDEYNNTADMDELVRGGTLRTEIARSDLGNLTKLAEGRLDLAVVDRRVLEYLQSRHDQLKALRFNERLLERKSLHVCFPLTPEGKQALALLNRGLALTAKPPPTPQAVTP